MIEGVLASCYASFDHDLSHFAMTLMQWHPEIIKWIFGVNKVKPAMSVLLKKLVDGYWHKCNKQLVSSTTSTITSAVNFLEFLRDLRKKYYIIILKLFFINCLSCFAWNSLYIVVSFFQEK